MDFTLSNQGSNPGSDLEPNLGSNPTFHSAKQPGFLLALNVVVSHAKNNFLNRHLPTELLFLFKAKCISFCLHSIAMLSSQKVFVLTPKGRPPGPNHLVFF